MCNWHCSHDCSWSMDGGGAGSIWFLVFAAVRVNPVADYHGCFCSASLSYNQVYNLVCAIVQRLSWSIRNSAGRGRPAFYIPPPPLFLTRQPPLAPAASCDSSLRLAGGFAMPSSRRDGVFPHRGAQVPVPLVLPTRGGHVRRGFSSVGWPAVGRRRADSHPSSVGGRRRRGLRECGGEGHPPLKEVQQHACNRNKDSPFEV